MNTTKHLIPVEKPGQFDPIAITGEWVYNPITDRWACRNAVPAYYSDMGINPRALKDGQPHRNDDEPGGMKYYSMTASEN